jgi:mRNA interferase HicA
VNYREFARRLESSGCKEIPRKGAGSHRKWINPASGKGTVVPDWGHKDLKEGTIRGILKQLGIDIHDFEKA